MNVRRESLPFVMACALAGPALVWGDPVPPPRLVLSAARLSPARPPVPSFEPTLDAAPGRAAANPFASDSSATPAATAGTVLVAPATEAANISGPALDITNTGTGRAIGGTINNPANKLSAISGTTNGTAAGVLGTNTGVNGTAGKFQLTKAASAQAALIGVTAGTGNAMVGVITNTGNFETPAVLGQHNGTAAWGIGVEGDGGDIGVEGNGGNIGVQGVGLSYGLWAQSTGSTGAGLYAESTQGRGIVAFSSSNDGIYGGSDSGYGMSASSNSNFGLYAHSGSSLAAFFDGPVYANSTMTAQSYAVASDRNVKQSFEAVDAADVLDKIAALPISAWDYKDKPGIRHIGPMAQDFRAAFGLGADDTHIDMVDAAGVSLAAIQALQRQLKQRDAQLAEQQGQLQALRAAVEARFAALEQVAGIALPPATVGAQP